MKILVNRVKRVVYGKQSCQLKISILRSAEPFGYSQTGTQCVPNWLGHIIVCSWRWKTNSHSFYTDECAKSDWSSRQLEWQINSVFYECLLASQDKKAVRQEIFEKEPSKRPEDFIKDSYVLEFLDVEQESTLWPYRCRRNWNPTSETSVAELRSVSFEVSRL